MNQLARILLSAYACEPDRGSEPGVGWSWAVELSRLGHQVWVLTRTDNRTAIERKPGLNLNFIYYDLPRWMQFCRTGAAGKLSTTCCGNGAPPGTFENYFQHCRSTRCST